VTTEPQAARPQQQQQKASWRDVVSAIRLALEGAGDDRTKVAMVEALVVKAPPTEDADRNSVKLFLDTARSLGAQIKVAE